jgi:hypothetical protein
LTLPDVGGVTFLFTALASGLAFILPLMILYPHTSGLNSPIYLTKNTLLLSYVVKVLQINDKNNKIDLLVAKYGGVKYVD